jgi:hypothetical protein
VVITPPCNLAAKGLLSLQSSLDANNPTKLQVEGYDQYGELLGGIELQLLPGLHKIYAPVIQRAPAAAAGAMLSPTPQRTGWLSYLPVAFILLGWLGWTFRSKQVG